jgi:transcriptional regulator with PAS, ATPase and Fis domain
MRQRLLLALVLVLTAGVSTATIVARRMARPQHSLTEAARALADSDDDKAEAARRLGVSERTLWYKLKKYRL